MLATLSEDGIAYASDVLAYIDGRKTVQGLGELSAVLSQIALSDMGVSADWQTAFTAQSVVYHVFRMLREADKRSVQE